MKKIMKKNQVIITSLAILIAVAGYLNFSDVNLGKKEQETSADSSSILDELEFDLSDEQALLEENAIEEDTEGDGMPISDSPGEAVLTSSTGFAAQAKLSREQIRSQNKADLKSIIENGELSDESKQEAIRSMVEMTEIAEKEAAAELLLEAKGFENVIVNLTGETADVVVPNAYLEDAKRAQIEDIVKRKTGIVETNIVITSLVNQSEDYEDTLEEDAVLEETATEPLYYEDMESAEPLYEDYELITDGIYD